MFGYVIVSKLTKFFRGVTFFDVPGTLSHRSNNCFGRPSADLA